MASGRFVAKKLIHCKSRGYIWGVWDVHEARWMPDAPMLRDQAMRRARNYNQELGYI